MSTTLHIEIPDDVLLSLQSEPENFASELRLAAAVKWYEMEQISQSKAAEIAGLSRASFIAALERFSVSPFQESAEEVEKEP